MRGKIKRQAIEAGVNLKAESHFEEARLLPYSPRKFYNEESGQVKNLPPLRFLEESTKWFARGAQLFRATALIA